MAAIVREQVLGSLHKQIPHHKLNPLRNFGKERGKFQKEEEAMDNFAAFSQVEALCPAWSAHHPGAQTSQIKNPVPVPLQAQHCSYHAQHKTSVWPGLSPPQQVDKGVFEGSDAAGVQPQL